MSVEAILSGYAAVADDQIARAAAIDPEQLLAPVRAWLPATPGAVLDVGAGAGRNAEWLVGQGCAVTAVEPVAALRAAGRERCGAARWIDDRLPHLSAIEGRFDLILLSAVWQHLDAPDRGVAVPRLTELLAPGGVLILSMRHGRGGAGRAVFSCRPEETIEQAEAVGLTLRRRTEAPSVQPENAANGVNWTWLVLAR